MNISNVNNSGGVNTGQQVNQPGNTGTAETARRANENVAGGGVTRTGDTYQNTRDREISELATLAAQIPNEPREGAVSQARERVSQGYYSQPNVARNVAMQLINTGNQG